MTKTISEKDYNNLLDALDILKLQKITTYSGLDFKIHASRFNGFLSNNNNTFISPPLFTATKPTIINDIEFNVDLKITSPNDKKNYKKEEYHENLDSNSLDTIKLLNVHDGSIRNSFKTMPWQDIEYINDCIENEQDINHKKNLEQQVNSDLVELQNRLKKIIGHKLYKKPVIKDFFDEETKKIFEQYDHEGVETPPSGISVLPEGLSNIRAVTQFKREKEAKAQIEKLIKDAEKCSFKTVEGKYALISISLMIGEVVKKFSFETKKTNREFSFKELKDFRDDIHEVMGRLTVNRKFSKLVENKSKEDNKEKIFSDIKDYITQGLKNLLEKLEISKNVEQPTLLERCKELFYLAIPPTERESENGKKAIEICENKKFSDKDKYQKICTELLKILQRPNIKIVDKNVQSLEEAAKIHQKIVCYEEFHKAIGNVNITTEKSSTSPEIAVKNKLDLVLRSLESIKKSTEEKIQQNQDDFLKTRLACEQDIEFHYFHLAHLIFIGEARKELMGMDLFKKHVNLNLLKEFEFLRWARNSLMHDHEIKMLGSTFELFGNDLLEKKNIKHSAASAYDSKGFYEFMKKEIEDIKQKIVNEEETSSNYKEQQTELYSHLMIQELDIAHKNHLVDAEIIIKKQLKKFGIIKSSKQDTKEILANKYYLDLGVIYDNKTSIENIAKDAEIELISLFPYQSNLKGLIKQQDKDIFFVVNIEKSSSERLVFFKQKMKNLLKYDVSIVTSNDFQEYLKHHNRGKKIEDLPIYYKDYKFSKMMNTIELYKAIEDNQNVEQIEDILQKECDLNFIHHEESMLYMAYYSDRQDILDLLLKYGADVNILGCYGQTLLKVAIDDLFDEQQRGLNFIMQAQGVKLSVTPEDIWKVSPLHFLAHLQEKDPEKFFFKAAKQLIKNASAEELDQIDGYGKTALLEAIEQDNIEIALLLATHSKINVNIVKVKPLYSCTEYTPQGCSPLVMATILGYNEVVKELLTHKDIDIINSRLLEFPQVGCKDNKFYVEKNPLNKGKLKLDYNSNILHVAVITGNKVALEIFLSHFGLEILLKPDYHGKTILHRACEHNQEEIVKLLLDKKALDNLFSEKFGMISEETYRKFLNFKDIFSQSAFCSLDGEDQKELQILFVKNQYFQLHSLEGSIGKTPVDLINEESYKIESSSKEKIEMVPKKIMKKLGYSFEEGWFGEIVLPYIGVDDLINLYLYKEPIKTLAISRKTLQEEEFKITYAYLISFVVDEEIEVRINKIFNELQSNQAYDDDIEINININYDGITKKQLKSYCESQLKLKASSDLSFKDMICRICLNEEAITLLKESVIENNNQQNDDKQISLNSDIGLKSDLNNEPKIKFNKIEDIIGTINKPQKHYIIQPNEQILENNQQIIEQNPHVNSVDFIDTNKDNVEPWGNTSSEDEN